jgi:hypothetical protein
MGTEGRSPRIGDSGIVRSMGSYAQWFLGRGYKPNDHERGRAGLDLATYRSTR